MRSPLPPDTLGFVPGPPLRAALGWGPLGPGTGGPGWRAWLGWVGSEREHPEMAGGSGQGTSFRGLWMRGWHLGVGEAAPYGRPCMWGPGGQPGTRPGAVGGTSGPERFCCHKVSGTGRVCSWGRAAVPGSGDRRGWAEAGVSGSLELLCAGSVRGQGQCQQETRGGQGPCGPAALSQETGGLQSPRAAWASCSLGACIWGGSPGFTAMCPRVGPPLRRAAQGRLASVMEGQPAHATLSAFSSVPSSRLGQLLLP